MTEISNLKKEFTRKFTIKYVFDFFRARFGTGISTANLLIRQRELNSMSRFMETEINNPKQHEKQLVNRMKKHSL